MSRSIPPAVLLSLLLVPAAPAQEPDPARLQAAAEEAFQAGEALRVIVTVEAPDLDFSELRLLRETRAAREERLALIQRHEAEARVLQAPVVAGVVALGGEILSQYWIVPAFNATIPPERLEALQAMPGVAMVEHDPLLPVTLETATNSSHHNADGAYTQQGPGGQAVMGHGQVVAIIDTGADGNMGGTGRPHRVYYVDGDPSNQTGGGIQGSQLLSMDDYSNGGTPEDTYGHGTNTASCAAGEDYIPGNSTDNRGMAPSAAIRSLNIDEGGGGAYLGNMVRAFQALAGYGDVTVANMSFSGDPNINSSLAKAVDRVVNTDDIVVTLSAGNSGTSLGSAHGSLNSLTVGAVDKSKILASFSTRGPLNGRRYPILVATGVNVHTARINSESSSSNSTGTSFSAPITAGAALLVRQAAPEATALETKALILWGLDDVASGTANGLGLGYLRARKSVIEALAGNYTTVKIDRETGVESYYLNLNAGEEFRIAAIWNRQNANNASYHDVRVTVYNPDSTVLETQGNGKDLFAHFRRNAVQTGLHRVAFELPVLETDTGDAYVGVAGLGSAEPGNQVSLVIDDFGTVGSTVTVEISDGEANAAYAVYAGFNPKPVVIGGARMDVGQAKLVKTGNLDASGGDTFTASVPRKVANRTVYVEALVQGIGGPMDSNLEVLQVN